MITVYVFPGGHGQPSLSPFCTKVVAHLGLAEIEHQARIGDLRKSPTKKLPYARFGDEDVPDSELILARATELEGRDLDEGLEAGARSITHTVRRTLEEHLYFVLLQARWVDDEGWKHQGPLVAEFFPAFLRPVLPPILRGGVKRTLKTQGVGRLPPEEIYRRGAEDLRAVEALASAEGPFFFGETPRSIDAVVYAFAGAAARTPNPNTFTTTARESERLTRVTEAVEMRLRAAGVVEAEHP